MQEEMIEEILLPTDLIWNSPYFYLGSERFIPKIFESHHSEEPVPVEFNAVCMTLDGRMVSEMDWKEQRKAALRAVEQNLKLFWILDLGIFSDLGWPIADETQFQALALALKHFRDTLWEEFKADTIGLCLYRGEGDFSKGYPWDPQQEENYHKWLQKHQVPEQAYFKRLFCYDVAGEYLELLARGMPDTMQIFAMLDIGSIENPMEIAQLISKERFEKIHLAIKGIESYPLPGFAWQNGRATAGFIGRRVLHVVEEKVNLAVCLPETEIALVAYQVEMEAAFARLHENGIPYKIIPEANLITEWDGLDYLIFSPSGLSAQGKRKLQGFCAAGGIAVSTGQMLELTNEINFQALLDKLI